jgi:hypothetical protein
MANITLMVSIIDGKMHLLSLRRNVKTYQPIGEPLVDVDLETVEEYCKKAHEIIVTSDFPSCNYYWGRFPKVGRHYLQEIVERDSQNNFGYVGPVRVAFQNVGQTVEDHVPKRILACMVIDDREVVQIENEFFKKYRHKIKQINSLPTALCALVAQTENPGQDFMIISVGDVSTTMAISSPKGDVKVARQIPIGFGEDTDCNDTDRCKFFINEIEKEITNTNLYYLQNFQGAQCNTYYMVGSPTLRLAMERQGTDQFASAIKFGFSRSPLSSLDFNQAAACAHLFGALYCHKNYNLLSHQIVHVRNFNRVYQYAIVAIASAVLCSGLYLYMIDPVSGDKISDYQSKAGQLEALQNDVAQLKDQVNALNQFSGWKTFYRNTYKNQPAWTTLFSEMANCQPKEIVIESFRIDPVAGKDVRGWNGIITGNINVTDWNQGLKCLRDFGKKLNLSPNFKIEKVRYAPTLDKENRPTAEISFNFQLDVQLITQDTEQ